MNARIKMAAPRRIVVTRISNVTKSDKGMTATDMTVSIRNGSDGDPFPLSDTFFF